MNPRLKTSKKSTSFPKEFLAQIEEVFSENFKAHLKHSKLVVEGRIYTEEILLRVGIREKGRLSQANFEVSMNYSPKSKDALERIHDCVDALASMMNEYFTSAEEEADFPRTWQEYEFNKQKLFLQFTTENSDLEAQADALLGKSFEEMVKEDQESEDALTKAEEKIEEEASGPTMMGGKKKKKSDLH
ncbi:MAG: hypothetical protein ACAH59_04745 [Pseudobdellovibrionaceae bacterium]